MSSYNVEACNYKYRVSSLEKVVDGDTIDVNIDLGFDVCTKQRVRLLGIDTPESRTSDKEEKVFGLLSKKKLKELKAPMPGLVVRILANEGDEIPKGGSLLVLEAMKMQTTVTAPEDGVVEELAVDFGETVEVKDLLVRLRKE